MPPLTDRLIRAIGRDCIIERETDGRFIADVESMPGCMAYGNTKPDAIRNVAAIVFRKIADDIELGS